MNRKQSELNAPGGGYQATLTYSLKTGVHPVRNIEPK